MSNVDPGRRHEPLSAAAEALRTDFADAEARVYEAKYLIQDEQDLGHMRVSTILEAVTPEGPLAVAGRLQFAADALFAISRLVGQPLEHVNVTRQGFPVVETLFDAGRSGSLHYRTRGDGSLLDVSFHSFLTSEAEFVIGVDPESGGATLSMQRDRVPRVAKGLAPIRLDLLARLVTVFGETNLEVVGTPAHDWALRLLAAQGTTEQ